MFVVIDRIEVKPGQRQHFVACWRTVHEAVEEQCSGSGSRLHATDDGIYLSYTEWPDRHTWEQCAVPKAYASVDESMRQACETVERLYELEVVMDLSGAGRT
jgi:heme-degrading monooxygenase HmoA